ncbi:hypothetical protein CLHUN_39950 [Ruminiclostridium hungatei]|uniref:Sporulation protein YyaC n=1 Tax=Ruminiclostridium hungatei TaxID=48256 RepID=A0A1V4SE06_RUMHU|nr:spore protease YyaC [Ruminiclostridium hungatei]OPX42090.1 hypothetical protein CLHUN_39950 [Ruminiclostridium hungatei]
MNFGTRASNVKYIDSAAANAFAMFSEAMYQLVKTVRTDKNRDIVIVCIGTDRSTGDSLGPIIGHKLRGLRQDRIHVFGNLDIPVHAKNLEEITKQIYSSHDNPFVIAVDACLGKVEHVGHITVGQGPLKPGSAVNKDLQPIGDMHITGIVNFSGFMDFLILQNTRLGTVMKMADLISGGIKYVLWRISRDEMLGRTVTMAPPAVQNGTDRLVNEINL